MARRKSGQVVTWSIVGLLVLAMAGFGLNGQLANRDAETVMRVGDVEISADDYAAAMQRAINNFSAQQGRPLTFAEAELLGIPNQVRRELIFQASLEQTFQNGDLEVSDEAILRAVREVPSFQDANGNYQRRNLELFLDARGISENELLDSVRDDVLQQSTADIIASGSPALDNIVDRLADRLGEKRALTYIRVDPQTKDVALATDEDARAEYDANPDLYMAEPVSKYALAYALPDLDAVTDAEIEAVYAERSSEFSRPASIDYEVLTFDGDSPQIATNEDFDAALVDRGLTANDVRFENATADDLPSELVSDIEEIGAGIFGPYASAFGNSVYRVSNYTAAQTLSVDDLRPILTGIVARDKMSEQLRDEFETIDAMVDAGAEPQAVADATSLEFLEYSSNDEPIEGLSQDPNFVGEANAANVGETRPLVKLENGGLAYFTLLALGEPQPLDFDKTKDAIKTALDNTAKRDAAIALAENLTEQLQAGGDLATLATDNDLTVETSELASQNEHYQSLPFLLAFEMFEREENEVFSLDDQDFAYVATVSAVEPFDSADDPELTNRLSTEVENNMRNQILEGYYRSASDNYEVLVNQTLMDNIEAQL